MAKLTPANKVKIFQQLNEKGLPWENSRFVIKEDEYGWLGNGNFSEVYVMENVADDSVKYAVKIIGLNEHRRIYRSDIASYKKEPILQFGLAEQCSTVVKIMDTEVISIKLDEKCVVEEARLDDFGVEKEGWLVLVMIKMECLLPIIEQNFTGDYSFKIPALKKSEDKEILTLAIDIAEALVTSHEMGIMHRDVKLENIFYDEKSQSYKLGDFGIARITNQGSASTKGAGTLGYEAPEVEGGNDAKYSYQADIYSFGVTIYLLMNELKFPGSTGYHVRRDIQYNPNAAIEAPMHGEEELKSLICSLIQFSPSDRPGSMAEVLTQLEQIYIPRYGEKQSHRIEKKQSKVSKEVETIQTNIVAEANHEPEPESGTIPTATVYAVKPKENVVKGILGGLFLCIGLLYFCLLSRETLTILKTPMVFVSLAANSILSVAAYYLKFVKKKKMPYPVYFLLFVFSIVVMITGGKSWLYIILSVGLFIGGVTEVFYMHIAAWIYIALSTLSLATVPASENLLRFAWIFFALTAFGFILTEQYDRQEDLFGIMFGNEATCYVGGFFLLIAGVVLFLLNMIPAIPIAPLLMKMHFIYVGVFLWIAGGVTNAIDRRTS